MIRDRISTSMKRATVMFTLPGDGRVTVQENAEKSDPNLRRAIEKARKVFFEEYEKGKREDEQR